MGKAFPFAIQILIKTEILKMTALRDTLVDQSEHLSTYLFCFVASTGVFYTCVWPNYTE